MSPDTATRAREMLAKSNPRVVRSSILTLPENPLTNFKWSIDPRGRKCEPPSLHSPREHYTWLSEVLSAKEASRLWEFLGLRGTPSMRSHEARASTITQIQSVRGER